jgi:hypothetical protein
MPALITSLQKPLVGFHMETILINAVPMRKYMINATQHKHVNMQVYHACQKPYSIILCKKQNRKSTMHMGLQGLSYKMFPELTSIGCKEKLSTSITVTKTLLLNVQVTNNYICCEW